MKRELSLYLDIVRFCAAMVVFTSHVSLRRLTGDFLWQFEALGGQAVIVFFVLSGFVIGFVTERREDNVKVYTINRLSRIYSVAIPALILTLLLDTYGKALRPDLYAGWGQDGYSVLWQYLSGLFFLNELWFFHIPQGSDLPYWSLGFEVWYYIVFGLAFFSPRKWRLVNVTAAALIAGPKIMVLFPLWLLGVACYHFMKGLEKRRLLGSALFVGSLAGGICYNIWLIRGGHLPRTGYWLLNQPQLPQDYLIGVLFAINLIGFAMAAPEGLFNRHARQIRWVSGATFSIYLFHFPIMHFLAAELFWAPSAWKTRILIIFGTLACCFVLAEFTERRKNVWRSGFGKLWARIIVAPAS